VKWLNMTQGWSFGEAVLAKTAIATLILLGVGCAERGPAVASAALPRTDRGTSPAKPDYITREVRHELVMLPYYGVFDNLSYRVDGDTVTLLGQVTRPTLKSDAEKAVKDVEGVERVVNEIEVLPLSGVDDQIRLAAYRSIYSFEGLNRYGLQAVPPIHIIVKNGNVTLEGVVSNDADRNMANIRANSVANVFSVENRLRVQP
jgi:BON domain-containing protein